MAYIDANNLRRQTPMAGTFGNVAQSTETITVTDASADDVLRFIKLPAFVRLLDLQVVHGDGGSSRTMSFGFEHVDGSGGADATYFAPATSIATAGRLRATAAKAPIVTAKETFITGTLAGGGITGPVDVTVTVLYEFLSR